MLSLQPIIDIAIPLSVFDWGLINFFSFTTSGHFSLAYLRTVATSATVETEATLEKVSLSLAARGITSATGDTAEVRDIEIDTVQQFLVVARRKEALVVGSISFTRTRAGFALKH